MADYPRTVVLESDKLKALIQEKTDLVLEGREKSEEIETVEADMKAIDAEISKIEQAVDKSDIDAQAKEVTEEMNAVMEKMQKIKEELGARLKAAVPEMLIKQYEDAVEKKKTLEEERNKIALKVQKKNDKIIPLGRKVMKPFLQDEFEDYDTLRLEDGQVIGTIFSHMEMFKEHYAKRTNK